MRSLVLWSVVLVRYRHSDGQLCPHNTVMLVICDQWFYGQLCPYVTDAAVLCAHWLYVLRNILLILITS